MKDETPTLIVNPTKDDFVDQMSDEENVTHEYTLPSMVVATFPKYIASHIAKHLASKIALLGDSKKHYEDRYKNALESIYVKL